MELKKNEKYDVYRKSNQFFLIGLTIALAAVILAFEWKAKYELVIPEPQDSPFEPYLDIPITRITPPEPPKEPIERIEKKVERFSIDNVIESKNEIEYKVEEPNIDDIPIENLLPSAPPVETAPTYFEPFALDEEVKGIEKFRKHIQRNLLIPKQAIRMGISGTVFVQFIVNEDGTVSDVQVLRGIGFGCDEAAVEVVRSAPKFIPGKYNGRTVRSRMVLPVVISVQ